MSTGDGIAGLTDQARLAGEYRRANPEGITLLVLTKSRGDAAAIVHDVAHRVYPGRLFGPILFMEQDINQDWLVTLQDDGPERPNQTSRTIHPAQGGDERHASAGFAATSGPAQPLPERDYIVMRRVG